MYTTKGTLISAAFCGNCSVCRNTYHHSYYETCDGRQFFYSPDEQQQQYFQTTAKTVFEVELLKQLTIQMIFSACTFESQAQVYNTLHGPSDQVCLRKFTANFRRSNLHDHIDGLDWMLNVTRLEDGWFMYQLVSSFAQLGILDKHDFASYTAGNRRDIESFCQKAMLIISTSPPKWVQHSCNVSGCKEGMVTIDGNEKLTRSMCAAPKSKVMCPVNHVNLVQCCSHSPISGGRHQLSSRFCHEHQHLVSNDVSSVSSDVSMKVSIPKHLLTNSQLSSANLGELPDSDCESLLTGCRKGSNVNKFFDRTAGVAAVVRPCGIIVNLTEMFTCESPTQMYIFLVFSFAHGRDIDRLKFVAYDRACDLHPFLCNLHKKGTYFADFLLRHVKFCVDRFHVSKHIEPCCKPPSKDNPNSKYHPDLPIFQAISSANTECAEQAFKWLNRYKTILRNMKQYRFNFFLYIIINLHNCHREQQLRHSRLM